jgi:hypothetical protein
MVMLMISLSVLSFITLDSRSATYSGFFISAVVGRLYDSYILSYSFNPELLIIFSALKLLLKS